MDTTMVKLNHLIYNLELVKDDIEAKVVEMNRLHKDIKQTLHSLKETLNVPDQSHANS